MARGSTKGGHVFPVHPMDTAPNVTSVTPNWTIDIP